MNSALLSALFPFQSNKRPAYVHFPISIASLPLLGLYLVVFLYIILILFLQSFYSSQIKLEYFALFLIIFLHFDPDPDFPFHSNILVLLVIYNQLPYFYLWGDPNCLCDPICDPMSLVYTCDTHLSVIRPWCFWDSVSLWLEKWMVSVRKSMIIFSTLSKNISSQFFFCKHMRGFLFKIYGIMMESFNKHTVHLVKN